MRSRVTDDGGFALALVMGAVALITAVAIGGYMLASMTLNDARVVRADNMAYQAASTGLEYELARFDARRLDSSGRYAITRTYGGANDNLYTYTVEVAKTDVNKYQMTSVGHDVSGRSETILVDFTSMSLWDMNISGTEDKSSAFAARGFKGNAAIFGALYVQGSAEQGGNSKIYDGPVYFRPTSPADTWIPSSNSAGIGSPTEPVDFYGDPTQVTSDYYIERKGSAPEFSIPRLTDQDMIDYGNMAFRWGATDVQTIGAAMSRPSFSVADRGDGKMVLAFNNIDNKVPVIYWNGPGDLTIANNVVGYTGRGLIVSRTNIKVMGDFLPYDPADPMSYVRSDGETLGPQPPGPSDVNWVNPPIQSQDKAMCGMLTLGTVTLASCPDGVAASIMCNMEFNMQQTNSNFRGSVIAGFLNLDGQNIKFANQTGLGAMIENSLAGMPKLSAIIARNDWVRR